MKIETEDGIDHGDGILEDCLEAVVIRFQDGFLLCPMLWAGGKCEECYDVFERRSERYE